jgi:hypothetical protein
MSRVNATPLFARLNATETIGRGCVYNVNLRLNFSSLIIKKLDLTTHPPGGIIAGIKKRPSRFSPHTCGT